MRPFKRPHSSPARPRRHSTPSGMAGVCRTTTRNRSCTLQPDRIRAQVPAPLRQILRRAKRSMARGFHGCSVEILTPSSGALVSDAGIVEGSAGTGGFVPVGSGPPQSFDGWWPQGAGAVTVDRCRWKVSANYGNPQDAGCDFEIAALVVGQATHELWTDWVARVKETGLFAPVPLPHATFVFGEAYRTVRRE